jgi:hypothetical protein
MNFEFIEGRETRDKVVKFGGVGITDEEIVNNKGKCGGVGVVAEKHGGGCFGVAVLGKEGDKTKLRQEAGLGKARDSLEDITKNERFAVGVTEERKETKFCEGGEGDGRHINADRLRRGKNGTKVVIDNVDGGHEGVGRDNGMKKSVDCGKGGCVGAYVVVYLYSVSSYSPSDSCLSQSVHLIPLLLHHPLEIGGGLRGTHHREEALEGDQELYQLLFIRKRPLPAMWPANSGEEGERLPCPVEV